MTERTLYQRLGGVDAIALVVDRFSDQIVTNPKLNVNPALKEYNEKGNLPRLKFMRTLWLCAAAGALFLHGQGAERSPRGPPYHFGRVRRGWSGDQPCARLLQCARAGKAGSFGRDSRKEGRGDQSFPLRTARSQGGPGCGCRASRATMTISIADKRLFQNSYPLQRCLSPTHGGFLANNPTAWVRGLRRGVGFREFRTGEVRRILLPRTRVNSVGCSQGVSLGKAYQRWR
jgi:hypothetical protein